MPILLEQNWCACVSHRKMVAQDSINHDILPNDIRAFARNYRKQQKDLLFINENGVHCKKYPPLQCPLHARPCTIAMPHLSQQAISFAHNAMGNQSIAKVLLWIKDHHTWPTIRCNVGQYVSQCLTCQQACDKPVYVRLHQKHIPSRYINGMVQYEMGH